jgi:hypothetical protein
VVDKLLEEVDREAYTAVLPPARITLCNSAFPVGGLEHCRLG